jgi:hypothetical protein
VCGSSEEGARRIGIGFLYIELVSFFVYRIGIVISKWHRFFYVQLVSYWGLRWHRYKGLVSSCVARLLVHGVIVQLVLVVLASALGNFAVARRTIVVPPRLPQAPAWQAGMPRWGHSHDKSDWTSSGSQQNQYQ